MNSHTASNPRSQLRPASLAIAAMLTALLLAACGSTKVITADKTIVYKDEIYNVSSVRTISPERTMTLADGSTRDLSGLDSRALKELFNGADDPVVRLAIMLDESELLYARGTVDSYRQYDRLADRFDDALRDVRRFLADAKKTQLELR